MMIVVLAMLLGLAGTAMVQSGIYANDQQRYRVGIVGDTDDEMIKLGVQMIQTADDTRYMIELVSYDDEDEAVADLRATKISSYIVITDEFSQALDAMTNDVKLKYYATSGQKGITNIMMDEIASVAGNIIVSSETGICTLRQVMEEEGFSGSQRHEQINKMFVVYLSALLNRSEVAEFVELGLSDGLSTEAYYFVGILLFFILLLSFCAISFFLGQSEATFRFLKSKGVGARMQVLAEYLAFLTINFLCVLIIMVAMILAAHLGLFSIQELGHHQVMGLVNFAISLIPVCMMFAALGFMIFEILIGVINKVLVAFMLYIGMAYVSGYFYPRSFFPEAVQTIGRYIPTGAAFNYATAIFTHQPSGVYMLVCVVYTVVFLGVAMVVRRKKIY